ncbi:trp operon leader peptide [Streptomyces sp. NPDC001595]
MSGLPDHAQQVRRGRRGTDTGDASRSWGRVRRMFAHSIQTCIQNWWWTASPAAR